MTRSVALDLVPPTFHWMPPYAATLGDEVADLAALAGFTPDPEQRLALDMLFATDARGKSAVRDFGVVAPRQNLKTGLLKQACLGWLYITEQRLVVWSAHEFGTSQEAFRDMCELIENCPDLEREIKAIHRGNGDEAIELEGDRRLKFKARTKAGGRGLTGDKIVLDEAMYLRPAHMGALVPTLRAVPDPQLIMAGSAGMADSDVWRDVRDQGRKGGDPSLGYLEFCDPNPGGCAAKDCDHRRDVEGCALDDRRRWWSCNTALGRRITEETLASDRRRLPPAEFARETLGWWDEPLSGAGLIDLVVWQALTDARSKAAKLTGFGFDVSPGMASASIGVAGVRADGLTHVELVQNEDGTDWCHERLVGLWEKWRKPIVLDPNSPAGAFAEDLEAAGVKVVSLKSSEYAEACQSFVNEVKALKVRHQGWPEVEAAIEAARKRDIGDGGWGWARKNVTVDISSLVALTLAMYGLGEPEPRQFWGALG